MLSSFQNGSIIFRRKITYGWTGARATRETAGFTAEIDIADRSSILFISLSA
jgi:hypothetical protein